MLQAPLCKILFSLGDSGGGCVPSEIQVMKGMSTEQIATIVGNELGCGYQKQIDIEIRNQLCNILMEGGGVERDERLWKQEMQKILGTCVKYKRQQTIHECNNSDDDEVSSEISHNRNTLSYFQNKISHQFTHQNTKQSIHHKHNDKVNGIYERGMVQRQKTNDKLSNLKKNQIYEQVSQCTFTPNIQNTFNFFHKHNPKFFKQETTKSNHDRNNTFQKLYKQSFDMRQKKKQRIKTVENDEHTKISQLSFIPEINNCSREICRIKSYASFVSDFSDIQPKSDQKSKTGKPFTKDKDKENTLKKDNSNYTFHPTISENTKKLTENLPSFYERLQLSKEKKKHIQKTQSVSHLKSNQNYLNKVQKSNKIKLKKQLYTIEDESDICSQKTQKKDKNLVGDHESYEKNIFNTPSIPKHYIKQGSHSIENKQKRSHQLFSNRKKVIFEAIFQFFTAKPSIKVHQFCLQKQREKNSSNVEVSMQDIEGNKYTPAFIKQLFSPVAEELSQLSIALNKDEFIWAMQKLFEGLSLADRGSLLGWGIKLLPEESK